MKCPIDGTDLLISERSGVEIDYCAQCRGVWLDRGELDKIIDRAEIGPLTRGYEPNTSLGVHGPYRGHGDERKPHGRRKREGFLGDLFDF
jgi:Zn-finger nucleic acid-binding protein